MILACLLVQEDYKPGDMPPEGYLAQHEWARIQGKAGLKQKQCGRCGLWRFPQELSGTVDKYHAKTNKGEVVEIVTAVCLECEAKKIGGKEE